MGKAVLKVGFNRKNNIIGRTSFIALDIKYEVSVKEGLL